MAKRVQLNIRWPQAGLVRKYAYAQQAPFSTADCSNVRPSGVYEGRERGGSRPGLEKAFYEELGSGAPVRLLDTLTVVAEDKKVFWTDLFTGSTLASIWSTASWIGTAPGVSDNLINVSYSETVGAVRDAVSDLDTGEDYSLEMYISPYQAAHHGKYQIFARMDNASPVATTDGIVAELVMEATGVYTGSLKVYVSGTPTNYAFTGGDMGAALGGWFRIFISGNNVTCYWRGTEERASTGVGSPAGARVGFGVDCTQSGGICLVDTFRFNYLSSNNTTEHRTYLLASAGGTLYKDADRGELSAIGGSLSLASDRLIHSTEYGQKLYIADDGNYRLKGTDGVRGTANDRLDAAGVSDWTAHSISTHDDYLIITDATGDIVDGVYAISALASGELTTATNIATGAAGTCTYRIIRGPKVYDPATDALALLAASTGSEPTGCDLICTYRGRVVWAGDPTAPHVAFMSRQDDPTDYNYGAADTDLQRAVYLTNSESGKVGEIITALVPHSDDYLLMGCTRSLWRLRGDVTYGGQLDAVSRAVGIVSKGAWCEGPIGEVVFLSRDGLYLLQPGGQSYPTSLSRERLPDELRNLDVSLVTITMAYDIAYRGVHIYLSRADGAPATHWWFDWELKSFWPVALQSDHEAFATAWYSSDNANDSAVLLGGRDGYVRRYSDLAESDEGTEIASWVKLGPIRLGGSDYIDGIITEMIGTLAEDSGPVTWEVATADTHEGALDASARDTGTWAAGLNRKNRPRARGRAVVVKLENQATNRAWALDSLVGVAMRRGRQRVL